MIKALLIPSADSCQPGPREKSGKAGDGWMSMRMGGAFKESRENNMHGVADHINIQFPSFHNNIARLNRNTLEDFERLTRSDSLWVGEHYDIPCP
jgi:hypothetical protein